MALFRRAAPLVRRALAAPRPAAASVAAAAPATTAARCFHAGVPARDHILRFSERYVAPGYEMKVQDVMEGVRDRVTGQQGLVAMEVLVDTDDPNRYNIMTRWESRAALEEWLGSDLCRELTAQLNGVLDRPVKYREFKPARSDVFLL